MKKIQINIDWSVVFWLGIITVFLWLIAKAVGLIHTPWFIQAIPYVGGLITLLAITKEIGRFVQKLETVILDVKDMKMDIREIKQSMYSLDKRVSILETRI